MQVRALKTQMRLEVQSPQTRLLSDLTVASAEAPVLSSWFIHVTWIIRNILAIPSVGMYGT